MTPKEGARAKRRRAIESWAPVNSFGDMYLKMQYTVSNQGRVRKRSRLIAIRKPWIAGRVNMTNDKGVRTQVRVKILVADAWFRHRTLGAPVRQIKKGFNYSVWNLVEIGNPKARAIHGRGLEIWQVRAIKRILASKRGKKLGIINHLAAKYRVNHATISCIRNGQRWGDVKI